MPKGFEYKSIFFCGKVTCSSEVNIADQCDQECYLIHRNIPIVRNTSLLSFKISLGNLMRSPFTWIPFRRGTYFPHINLAFSKSLVSTGQS